MLFHYYIVESKFCNYVYYELVTPDYIKTNNIEHVLVFTSHKDTSSVSFLSTKDVLPYYDEDMPDEQILNNSCTDTSLRNAITFINTLNKFSSLIVIPHNLDTYMSCLTLLNDIGKQSYRTCIFDEYDTLINKEEWNDKLTSLNINVIDMITA